MSDLVRQLIAQNKRSRATFLDLGNCGLTEVPAEVGELVWLESLSLASDWWEWDGRDWQPKTSRNAGGKNGRLNDIGALRGLTHLRSLAVSSTQVTDLAPLAGLSALQMLSVAFTRVTDLAPLAGLSALQYLSAGGTPVTNLAPLANLSALLRLYLFDTRITDVAPLAGLSALQILNISGTKVTDISALVPLINQGCPVRSSPISSGVRGIYVERCPLKSAYGDRKTGHRGHPQLLPGARVGRGRQFV